MALIDHSRNAITYHNALCSSPQNFAFKHCFPRETEDNAYAKFWGNKQRALWYAVVYTRVVNWYNKYARAISEKSLEQKSITKSRSKFSREIVLEFQK